MQFYNQGRTQDLLAPTFRKFNGKNTHFAILGGGGGRKLKWKELDQAEIVMGVKRMGIIEKGRR